jgi:hypothetical protein
MVDRFHDALAVPILSYVAILVDRSTAHATARPSATFSGMTKAAALLLAIAGCTRALGGDDPERQPPEPVRFDKPAMVKFHMQRHFDELRQISAPVSKASSRSSSAALAGTAAPGARTDRSTHARDGSVIAANLVMLARHALA